jgi:pyruvate dehydrogenase E2 component (dihydrolipoamide acetyltransferase)
MAVPIIMPRQGQSVESCIIGKWFKEIGDTVNVGDVLFSYETDKAAFEEEAKVSGTLLAVYAEEGDDVPVLTNVCVIGNTGEDISSFGPLIEGASTTVPDIEAPAAVNVAPVTMEAIAGEGKLKISPRAKNLAEKTGVDYRYAEGSGPYGRIIENDILELKANGIMVTSAARDMMGNKIIEGSGLGGRVTTKDINKPAEKPEFTVGNTYVTSSLAEVEEVKLTNIRKVIAKAMYNSISTTAQLTYNSSFDATEVMDFRKKLKTSKERMGLQNITLNDIIAYAVSRTLLDHRDLNAQFLDDKMLYFKNVHLGIAVDTDRGLMVPTLFNANLKSLNEVSAEIKMLVSECQKGTINPDLLKGGTFTITNLGTLGIESFTPVLNPPQTGILGINNITQRARENEKTGELEFYPAMGLSLTSDHRAIDGAPSARFLKDLGTNLENFSSLLVK